MAGSTGFWSEFKAFALRGSVVDLAVGVVVGSAFGAVTKSLVEDVLAPVTGVFGVPDMSDLQFALGEATVNYGLFLNAVFAFLLVTLALYVLVVKPINRLTERGAEAPKPVTDRPCPHCLSSIPKAATKCSFCTADVESV